MARTGEQATVGVGAAMTAIDTVTGLAAADIIA
jgi:hypothetical protein